MTKSVKDCLCSQKWPNFVSPKWSINKLCIKSQYDKIYCLFSVCIPKWPLFFPVPKITINQLFLLPKITNFYITYRNGISLDKPLCSQNDQLVCSKNDQSTNCVSNPSVTKFIVYFQFVSQNDQYIFSCTQNYQLTRCISLDFLTFGHLEILDFLDFCFDIFRHLF